MTIADLPLVLTVEEAAETLRISRGAAYEGCRTGEIPSVRIGRTIRVPRRAVAHLLGEQEDGSGAKMVRSSPYVQDDEY